MKGDPASTTRDRSRHPSPPLQVLAAAHATIFVASLVLTALLTGGGHLPSPFGPSEASFRFFAAHGDAVRWNAFLQLGSAVPLGLFAATAASRLHFLGVRAAGVAIALFGGVAASSFLSLSALAQWTVSWPDVTDSQAAVRALQLFAFAAGGPAHVMAMGLLIAGIAVTTGLARLLPRWMMTTGLALAVLAELSWVSLVLPAASLLLPLVRFPAFAWMIAAGALLPRSRREARASSPRRAVAPPGRYAAEGPP
jgi:hypothetical protein